MDPPFANTLGDLRENNARYILGEFGRGYGESCPIDDETKIIELQLADINRAGFITTCSQPGIETVQKPKGSKKYIKMNQRAFVEGFMRSDAFTSKIHEILSQSKVIVYAVSERFTFSCNAERTRTCVIMRGKKEYGWIGFSNSEFSIEDQVKHHFNVKFVDEMVREELIQEYCYVQFCYKKFGDYTSLWSYLSRFMHTL